MGNCCRGGGGTRTSDVKRQKRVGAMEGESTSHPPNDGHVMEMAPLEAHNGMVQDEEELEEVEVTALQHIADREGIFTSTGR